MPKPINPNYQCLSCKKKFETFFPETEKDISNPSCPFCSFVYVKWINFKEYKNQPAFLELEKFEY